MLTLSCKLRFERVILIRPVRLGIGWGWLPIAASVVDGENLCVCWMFDDGKTKTASATLKSMNTETNVSFFLKGQSVR